MLTLDRVYKAKRVLSEVVRQTDMIRAKNISSQCDVYLKTENLQVTGSFKVRGSYFKISQLSDEEKKKGVIACSAGNHAQGVALAATKNGIKSLICLPDGAPISKVEATKRYGADVCLVKGVYDDAYNKAIELQKEKGYTFIHPFNDPDVIAGQGTIGLEILEQLPDVDVVVVPIGGGGLIAGVAYTIKQINPNCKVYGVQAAGAPSMKNSVADGKIETLKNVQTIADGIAVKTPGTNTFELIKKYVDGIYTVSDDEIALAILTLMEQQKLVSEGAGAVPVAAVMNGKIPDIEGKKVCCLHPAAYYIPINDMYRAAILMLQFFQELLKEDLKWAAEVRLSLLLFPISRVSFSASARLLQITGLTLYLLIMTALTLI